MPFLRAVEDEVAPGAQVRDGDAGRAEALAEGRVVRHDGGLSGEGEGEGGGVRAPRGLDRGGWVGGGRARARGGCEGGVGAREGEGGPSPAVALGEGLKLAEHGGGDRDVGGAEQPGELRVEVDPELEGEEERVRVEEDQAAHGARAWAAGYKTMEDGRDSVPGASLLPFLEDARVVEGHPREGLGVEEDDPRGVARCLQGPARRLELVDDGQDVPARVPPRVGVHADEADDLRPAARPPQD